MSVRVLPSGENGQKTTKETPTYNGDIENALIDYLNGKRAIGGELTKTNAWVFRYDEIYEPQIVRIDPKTKIAKITCKEQLASELRNEMRGAGPLYKRIGSEMRKVVEEWIRQTEEEQPRLLKHFPKSITFKSDESIAFRRLDFDPIACERAELVHNCKFFHDLSMRMHNFEAFSMKVYSTYLGGASRKQVIWLDGVSNSGKSFIEFMLNQIFGGERGCVSLTLKDLNSPHYAEVLVDKSLVMVNEAASGFLKSEHFKVLTGDKLLGVNPKGKKMYQAKFDFHMLFASNHAPEIPNDITLKNRIIRCHLHHEIKASERIDEEELYEKIKAELPWFIGYGKKLYEELSSHVIPSSEIALEGMDDAIADHDSFYEYVFNQCFKVKIGARSCTNDMFVQRLKDSNYLAPGSGITLKGMKTYIENNYQITYRQLRDITVGKEADGSGGRLVRAFAGLEVKPFPKI